MGYPDLLTYLAPWHVWVEVSEKGCEAVAEYVFADANGNWQLSGEALAEHVFCCFGEDEACPPGPHTVSTVLRWYRHRIVPEPDGREAFKRTWKSAPRECWAGWWQPKYPHGPK